VLGLHLRLLDESNDLNLRRTDQLHSLEQLLQFFSERAQVDVHDDDGEEVDQDVEDLFILLLPKVADQHLSDI
jgi:hypothetical protein